MSKKLSAPPSLDWGDDLARESALVESHVKAVQERLLGDVRQWMSEDAGAEVTADVLLDAAVNLLIADMTEKQAETDARELEAARDHLKESLRASIAKGQSPFTVTPEEISNRARVIAKAVVNNWLVLVNESFWDSYEAGEELVLDDRWLPKGASDADLELGLAEDGAEPVRVVAVLRSYLDEKSAAEAGFEIDADFCVSIEDGVRRVVSHEVVTEAASAEGTAASAPVERIDEDKMIEGCLQMILSSNDMVATLPSSDDRLAAETNIRAGAVVAASSAEKVSSGRRPVLHVNPKVASGVADYVAKNSADFFPPSEKLSSHGSNQRRLLSREDLDVARRNSRAKLRPLAVLYFGIKENELTSDKEQEFLQIVEITQAATVISLALRKFKMTLDEKLKAHAELEKAKKLLKVPKSFPTPTQMEGAKALVAFTLQQRKTDLTHLHGRLKGYVA